MASSKGQVTLRGRFSKGSIVTLTRVAGEHVLRPEGGEDIETKTVSEKNGVSEVQFSTGVEVGARYFIHGLEDGVPIVLRARGRSAEDDSETLSQPPIKPDRVRMSDGSFADEAPTKESAPPAFVGPGPGQHQVPDSVPQRSSTLRGSAHPVDPDEQTPKRRQQDVPEGTPQMSDTRPRELDDGTVVGGGGEASEIVLGPQRQEDVPKGAPQRSSTPAGTASPIPAGDSVRAQLARESSAAKESRGEPGRAAAEPLEPKGAKTGPPSGASEKESEKRHAEITASDKAAKTIATDPVKDDRTAGPGVNRSGLDAQGQPVDPGVAAAVGIESASKPAEPVTKKAPAKKPAAKRSTAAKKSPGSRPAKPNSSKEK